MAQRQWGGRGGGRGIQISGNRVTDIEAEKSTRSTCTTWTSCTTNIPRISQESPANERTRTNIHYKHTNTHTHDQWLHTSISTFIYFCLLCGMPWNWIERASTKIWMKYNNLANQVSDEKLHVYYMTQCNGSKFWWRFCSDAFHALWTFVGDIFFFL